MTSILRLPSWRWLLFPQHWTASPRLKRTFEVIAPEYPEIEAHNIIVENCAHQPLKLPEQFEVIVTSNTNGDILSDLTSALIGGLGFAPSANIGSKIAIFEAVHGSAPKYARKNVISPGATCACGKGVPCSVGGGGCLL